MNHILQRWPFAPDQIMLARGDVHVWATALDQPPASVDQLARLLAADEQARVRQCLSHTRRAQLIVARGTLRTLLGRYLQVSPPSIAFSYGAHGKPTLAPPYDQIGLRFNLAHSHGLALYAFTFDRELGVDVELIRPRARLHQLARRFFSEREQQALFALPPDQQTEGFFNCWTRKEAYIKAVGAGMALPLRSFSVSLAPDEPARLLHADGDPHAATRWSFRSLDPADGYVAALATTGPIDQIKRWQWNATIDPITTSRK